MTLHATFFVFLSLGCGAVTREYPPGFRRHPHVHRELGARPDIPALSPFPTSTPLFASFPSVEPTVSPSGSSSPSIPPFTVIVPAEVSAQPTIANTSPQSMIPNPSLQPTIPTPSLPPVSIQIPTSNQATESVVPAADSDSPVVDVEAASSRSAPQKVLSAGAITGVVLGLSGLFLMGLVSSRRRGRKGTELIE